MVSMSGWIALSFFVTSFYLAARIPALNWIFDGLKRQLLWHHRVALLSFAAMLSHLGLLLWNYRAHFPVLFDLNNFSLLSGWISFAGVIFPIPLAFFRVQIPYRQWRVVHLITSFSLIAALVHCLLIYEPSRSGEWAIFLSITVLAVLALLLTVILPVSPFWGKKYVITKLSEVRPKLFLLQLQPNEKEISQNFHYDPGQFIYLRFFTQGFSRIWHPFTIVSKPSESYIELFIKARGKDTCQLKTIPLPTPVHILAPFGVSFWKLDQTQLWIAYGVGAAIFLAAIRSFPITYQNKIHFICCDDSMTKIFFSDELDRRMKESPNFTWEHYIGSGQQFVTDFRQNTLVTNFERVRICGHPKFQNSLKLMLILRGIPSQNIQLEGLL